MPSRSTPRLIAVAAVLLLAAALVARLAVAEVYRVPSRSMEPALTPGDQVVVVRFHRGDAPRRGEIVVFEDTDGRAWIKRVIGLPGEAVAVEGTHVAINGATLAEPWARGVSAPGRSVHLVPTGHYFVMGDNRENSDDSRAWGFVPREAMRGCARLVCWSRDAEGAVRWNRLLAPVE